MKSACEIKACIIEWRYIYALYFSNSLKNPNELSKQSDIFTNIFNCDDNSREISSFKQTRNGRIKNYAINK